MASKKQTSQRAVLVHWTAKDWCDQALRAIAQGQSELDFVSHSHANNRAIARAAYHQVTGTLAECDDVNTTENPLADVSYYEDAMARKTGSTVEQMRKEQAEFEKRLTADDQVLLKDNGSEPTPRR